jgi:DNA-binding PucR family transcriptional regulator
MVDRPTQRGGGAGGRRSGAANQRLRWESARLPTRPSPTEAATLPADDSGPVHAHVVAAAAALHTRLHEITTTMRALITGEIEELRDHRLITMLGASIESNVATILHILQRHIPLDHVEPPAAACEYARRLAQHDVPVTALVRGYRLGQDHLLKWTFEEIGRAADDSRIAFLASQRVVSVTFTYVDWMCEEIVAVYQAERQRWRDDRNTVRAARIRELLDNRGDDLDAAERAINHNLRQHHLGVVVWLPDTASADHALTRLEQSVNALARELSGPGRPLFAPQDRRSAWAWLPLGRTGRPVPSSAVERVLSTAAPGARAALGAPAPGLTGFRDTHRQALHAHRLALLAGPDAAPVTAYDDRGVPAAAILGSDLEQTRMLVRSALGPLATDDEHHARLRETLLTFLSASSNYTTSAQLLSMHKNSVKYRIAKAEEARGHPIGQDRLDVELALVACRWLGPAVLIPPPAPRT